MKKSVKIILYSSILVLIFLLYIVFKGVTNFSEVNDTSEVSDSSKVAKEMSYLKNTKKDYIIKEYSNKRGKQIQYVQKYVGKSKGYQTWFGTETVLEKENQYGLFYGELKVLAYPVEKGKEWSVNSYTFKIESVDQTIKIPAGTFKNVVEVRTTEKGTEGYTTAYYAKGMGQILRESVDDNAKKTIRYEIQKLTKKSTKRASDSIGF